MYKLLLFGAALWIGACQQYDEQLAQQLETDLQKWEAIGPRSDTALSAIVAFREKLESAAPELQRDSASGLPGLHFETQMHQKQFEANQKAFQDQLEQVRALLEEYRSGKVKEEDFTRRYNNNNRAIAGFSNYFDSNGIFLTAVEERYATIMKKFGPKNE